jgi:branched-chain amino acid transport system substrate-binding protein
MQRNRTALSVVALAASLLAASGLTSSALAKDIKIAHVYDKTGALEA